ncbi:hypothetical protein [Kitasatospora sp. NBC_01266]|uniref:hypothetical protein n=1 Tax=Kitasatospora sp. NBC_01266 TaxID=2903572 RepID=UPI002E3301FA|nr:hypothetical protein [Kitasatospora sp. NBC_01266]
MNRALLVIDVQESFRQLESWAAVSNPDTVGQVNEITARTEYALSGRFARIATVKELTGS